MNKKVIFWDIDKKRLTKINKDTKYVILTNKNYKDIDVSSFDIKPIVISFSGSLIVDLENNKIINNKVLNKNNLKVIINYFKSHDINYELIKDNDKIYQLKIESKNYYRMLVLPMFINSKFNDVKTLYGYPIKINKNLYQNYIISDKISSISNLNLIINYLDIMCTNIVELSCMIDDINNNINNYGYFKELDKRKEFINENQTKS